MIDSKKSLKAHYLEKVSSGKRFREEIIRVLGISEETFYIRIRKENWTLPEMNLLSQHFNQPTEVLFPQNSETHV